MSGKLHLTEIGRVAVPAADQDQALEFYVGTLGFAPPGGSTAIGRTADGGQSDRCRHRDRHLDRRDRGRPRSAEGGRSRRRRRDCSLGTP